MRTSTRWTLFVLAILGVLAVVLVMQIDDAGPSSAPSAPAARAHRDVDTPEALAEPRLRAGLPPCPATGSAPGPAVLAGVMVECASDGSVVDVGRAIAGRAVVLNMWAAWCVPCADELPAMQEYQRRAGDSVTVVAVHQDENETAALVRMQSLGVRLPMLQDGRRTIAAALGLPNVMPTTVVLRPDGSVAAVLPQPFTSADDIESAVDAALR